MAIVGTPTDLYDVVMPDHEVHRGTRSWRVRETTIRLGATSVDRARVKGARTAHIEAGVPAMRSLLIQSIAKARATVVPRYGPRAPLP